MKRTLNTTINRSKNEKNDEHYTQLADIENEVRHYRDQFRGKTVLCNCDDPRCSNFFKYFTRSFEILGLKRVIATCYKSQDVDLFTQKTCEKAVYQIYDGDANGNRGWTTRKSPSRNWMVTAVSTVPNACAYLTGQTLW